MPVLLINQGTQSAVNFDLSGTTYTQVVHIATGTIATLPNIPGGTVNLATRVGNLGTLESGTIASLPNLPGGTINAGTVVMTAGTVRNDGRTTRNIMTYGTTFGGTAAGYATLVAAPGVGTSTWVSDLSVNNAYGSITCIVGFGTFLQGTSVLMRGIYGTQVGVGIQKTYALPVNAGATNTDLVAYIGAAGTIDVNLSYFVSA